MNPTNVLVIDDDQGVRHTIETVLSAKGFRVRTAPDGEVGLRLLTEFQADLVVTDIIMPEKEGIETIIAIKDRFPKVKIVAMSGGGRTSEPFDVLDAAKELGADCVLVKPFDVDQLMEAVESGLSHRSKTDELERMQLTKAQLLGSLAGIAYITDRSGRIVAVSETNWCRFAADSDASELTDLSNVVGRDLLEFVAGSQLQEIYSMILEEMVSGRARAFSFAFSCDAPDVSRNLWMMINPLATGAVIEGVLFHSIVLSERARPRLDIFDFRSPIRRYGLNFTAPIVSMCSICQRIKASEPDSGEEARWLTAEEYYRLGGSSDVRISHGVCRDCIPVMLSGNLPATRNDHS